MLPAIIPRSIGPIIDITWRMSASGDIPGSPGETGQGVGVLGEVVLDLSELGLQRDADRIGQLLEERSFVVEEAPGPLGAVQRLEADRLVDVEAGHLLDLELGHPGQLLDGEAIHRDRR